MKKILYKIKEKILKFVSCIYKFLKEHIVKNKKLSIATAILVLVMVILQILRQFEYMREYVFSRNISRFFLSLLSKFSNLFPFSLSEIGIYLSVALGIHLIVKSIRHLIKKEYFKVSRISHVVVVIVLCVNVLLLSLFTMSYERESAIDRLDLPDVTATTENVVSAAEFFIEKTIELESQIERDENGDLLLPYTFDELSMMIAEEYEVFYDDDFYSTFVTEPKELMFGFINSYMGFTGYYSPFFAESNINTYQPPSSLPVTIAHELAHSKGIMRENEANFYAYYVLAMSDDPYLQYSGFLAMSQIMLNESYDAQNVEVYYGIFDLFSDEMNQEISNRYEFWENYDTFLDDIGDFFNNLYLKSSGIPSGTKNYSETGNILVKLWAKLENFEK